MVQTMADTGVSALPPAPRNPLPVRQQVRALRSLIDGVQQLIDAGGPVTRIALPVPRWLAPPVVLASSPQGIHDILGRQDGVVEKTKAHEEMRHLLGNNVFDLTHDAWLPRRRALQPVFTKKHVRRFSGHMSQAAEMIVALGRAVGHPQLVALVVGVRGEERAAADHVRDLRRATDGTAFSSTKRSRASFHSAA